MSSENKRFQCGICSKLFLRRTGLTQHLRQHTERFKCEICSKTFNHLRTLSSHMKMHSGKTEFKCEVCGKCLFYKCTLIQHMLLHSGEKNFHCEICGKSFLRRTDLICHMRRHTGEKRFQCKICGNTFMDSKKLSAHVHRHSGKLFCCDICQRKFLYKDYLRNHKRRIHSTEMLTCQVCGKRMRSLKSHMQWHKIQERLSSSHKYLPCPLCNMYFAWPGLVEQHLQVAHDVVSKECAEMLCLAKEENQTAVVIREGEGMCPMTSSHGSVHTV